MTAACLIHDLGAADYPPHHVVGSETCGLSGGISLLAGGERTVACTSEGSRCSYLNW
jgi:hypothetical protein